MAVSKKKYDYLELFSLREAERLKNLNKLTIEQFQKELESHKPLYQITKSKKKYEQIKRGERKEEKKREEEDRREGGEGGREEEKEESEKGTKLGEEEIRERGGGKEEGDLEGISKRGGKEEANFEEFLERERKWEQLILENQMRRKLKYGNKSLFSPLTTSYKRTKNKLPKTLPPKIRNEKIFITLDDKPATPKNEPKIDEPPETATKIEHKPTNQVIKIKIEMKKSFEETRKLKEEKKFGSLGLTDSIYRKCLEDIMSLK